MQKGTWIIVGALIVVVLLGGGYFLMNRSSNSATPAPVATTESDITDTTEADVLEIVVEGKDFSYTPSTLKIKVGQKVRVLFKNTGKAEHDFVVEELGVRTKIIEGGAEDVLEFVAPSTPGELNFYCSVGSHRAMGMEGTITVE